MSAESLALTPFHACKQSPIANYVKLWTCFHCKLDHDTLQGSGLFCYGNTDNARNTGCHELDEKVIEQQLEKRLRSASPKGYRGYGDTAKGYRKREAIPLFKLWLQQIVQSDLFYLGKTERCGMGLFA
jgi:hypothetical protein